MAVFQQVDCNLEGIFLSYESKSMETTTVILPIISLKYMYKFLLKITL